MSAKVVKRVGLIGLIAVAVLCATIFWVFQNWFVSRLPVERPEEISLSIHISSGMDDRFTSYELANGQVEYRYHNDAEDDTAEFDLADDELDYLWQRLRVLRFDHIHARQEPPAANDRGGTTIDLVFGDNAIELSDAGSSYITGGQAKRFYEVQEDMAYVAQPYLAARGIDTH